MHIRRVLTALSLILFVAPLELNAGGLGRALARGSAKSISKRVGSKAVRGRAVELLRDKQSPTRLLAKERLVDRYTLRRRATQELRSGIPPYRHMTSRSTKRPLSALTAQRRLGLPRKPQIVERIKIPKGTTVNMNKVVKGQPGYGEITSPRRLPARTIQRVIPLK